MMICNVLPVQESYNKSMNQILIVGHPLSGYERVEKSLVDNGMCPGRSTLNEQMSPSEIDATLCKSRGIAPLTPPHVNYTHPVAQLKVDPVWKDLVLDLIRGNLDLPFWGWSDPLAVYLLEFWKSNLPDLLFVLVYEHPRAVLNDVWRSRAEEGDSDSVVNAVNDGLSGWHHFNDAMLDFFYRNRERCLLVHSDQVAGDENVLFDEINAYWVHRQQQHDASQNGVFSDNSLAGLPAATYGNAKPASRVQFDSNDAASIVNKNVNAAGYLASAVVMENAECMVRLYEEMQAVATLPFSDSQGGEPGAIEAWYELNILSAERERCLCELNQLKERLSGLESAHSGAMASRCRTTDENDFLLSQVFSVQEELEAKLVEQQKGKRRIAELEKLHAQSGQRILALEKQLSETAPVKPAAKKKQPLGAAQRVKDGLAYRVGSKILKDARTVWKLSFLPLSIWSLIRKYRKSQQEADGNVPPLSAYADYGKALKVQNHLSYQLGVAWLESVHAPWFWVAMPLVMLHRYIQFRRKNNRNSRGIFK